MYASIILAPDELYTIMRALGLYVVRDPTWTCKKRVMERDVPAAMSL